MNHSSDADTEDSKLGSFLTPKRRAQQLCHVLPDADLIPGPTLATGYGAWRFFPTGGVRAPGRLTQYIEVDTGCGSL